MFDRYELEDLEWALDMMIADHRRSLLECQVRDNAKYEGYIASAEKLRDKIIRLLEVA